MVLGQEQAAEDGLVTAPLFAVLGIFTGVVLVIYASQGATALAWTLVGAILLVTSVVVVEVARKRD